MTLRSELVKRKMQLSIRLTSAKVYIKYPKSFLGKRQFTQKDITLLEKQIAETEAAIIGIDNWLKNK